MTENDKKNKIKVIIPFHNPGDYFDMCINSVLTQDYENFDVLFIDDCSTDDSYNKIPACVYKTDENNEPVKDEKGDLVITDIHPILEITKCKNVNAWKSNRKLTALPNIHNAIINVSKEPDDIIFILYGDDWLINKTVLSKINDFYNKNNCLMTYGSAKYSDGKKYYSAPYQEKDFNIIRRINRKFSHPLTFRKSLYNKFCEIDPQFESFKFKNNEWMTSCSIQAIFYPLADLAGFNSCQHMNDLIYVYNTDNPLNSEKTNTDLYYDTLDCIQDKKPLKK